MTDDVSLRFTPHETTRRTLLRGVGTLSLALLAGCSAIDSDPKPGAMLVVNNDDVAHTLALEITGNDETRTETADIGAAEWGLRNELLTEPGRYEVTVTLDDSEATTTATATVELTEAENGAVDGDTLEVHIDENATLSASTRRYD